MVSSQATFSKLVPHDILVIGSLVSDISCTYIRRSDEDSDARPQPGSSNEARITQCVGGVAHNIALTIHYLGASVLLASVIGDDSAGAFLLNEVEKEGLNGEGILRLRSSEEHGEVRTGQYVGNYNHDKEFLFGMADVELMLHPDTQIESTWRTLLSGTSPKIIVLDTTFSPKTTDIITKLAKEQGIVVIVEPVSQPRARDFALTGSFQKSRISKAQARTDMITPNAEELDALFQGAVNSGIFDQDLVGRSESLKMPFVSNPDIPKATQEKLRHRLYKVLLLLQYFPIIIITYGSDGCLLAVSQDPKTSDESIPGPASVCTLNWDDGTIKGCFEYVASPCKLGDSDLVSVNGAGDSLVGAVAVEWLEILQDSGGVGRSQRYSSVPWPAWQQILNRGQWAALATLQHQAAVGPAIRDLGAYKDKLLSQVSRGGGAD